MRKELEEMLEPEEEEFELPRAEVDFRELKVLYFCVAEEREAECVNYLPGPSGKCSRRDFSLSEVARICSLGREL